jgi:hypothetical protein
MNSKETAGAVERVTLALDAVAQSPAQDFDDGSHHAVKQAGLCALAALPPGIDLALVAKVQRKYLREWFAIEMWDVFAGTPDDYMPGLLDEIERAADDPKVRYSDQLAFVTAALRDGAPAGDSADDEAPMKVKRQARFRGAARAVAKLKIASRGPGTRVLAAASRFIAEDPVLLRAAQTTLSARRDDDSMVNTFQAYLWAALAQDATAASLAVLEREHERARAATSSTAREVLEHVTGLYADAPAIAAMLTQWGIPPHPPAAATPVKARQGRRPALAYRIDEGTRERHDGWARGRPPGLRPEQWPRHRHSAIPLAHVFTLRLPEEYRVRGPELVALSFFTQASDAPDTTETLASSATPHPTQRCNYEANDDWCDFAWVWLTEAELAGAPCPPPVLEGPADPSWALHLRAFEVSDVPPEWLALVPYDDPNVGLTPSDDEPEDAEAYTPWSSERGESIDLHEAIVTRGSGSHFGGTYLGVAFVGDIGGGLSKYFFELEDELAGLNLGGGEGVFDLERETWTWGN